MHSRITLTRRTSTCSVKHNVYTSAEIHSRMETQLEEYNKILHIEAMTMRRYGTRGDHSGVHRI